MEEYIVWENYEGYEVKITAESATYQLKMLFDMYPEGADEMEASVEGLKKHLKLAGTQIGQLVTENANLRVELNNLQVI